VPLAAVAAILALSSFVHCAGGERDARMVIVLDETGAVVPDVHVAVINLGTGPPNFGGFAMMSRRTIRGRGSGGFCG